MADKARYPQIPSTVWWGVHALVNKTPNATLDERFLSVHLNVQPVAAKQYIAELISVGILTEDFKASQLAMKWRLDASYSTAVKEILANVYPQSLMDVAPPGEGDRQKAISWFLQEGLGQGTATNKAATYLLIGSKTPNEAPVRTNGSRQNSEASVPKASRIEKKASPRVKTAQEKSSKKSGAVGVAPNETGAGIPLNVNVQIHISADASSDQIESIFSAMRRYLYDKQTS
jgi:hypothetical protein